jgi:FlaG/FlaF family flagellin (archaellin)
MKTFLQAAAMSLLIAGFASAQSVPSGQTADQARVGTDASATAERLLDQRAGSALLAHAVDAADRTVLAAETARHREYGDMRAMDVDVSNHDVGVALVAAAVVILLIWAF